MWKFLCLLALIPAGHAIAQTPALSGSPTTVILVRHAEKAAIGTPGNMGKTDVPLSAAGVARSKELERVLRDAGIKAIFTSTARRTIDTAQPAAAAWGITPEPTNDVAAVVREIRDHPGRTTLIVHHSNTVPMIMQALGAPSLPEIPDSEYDGLYIVTIAGSSTTAVKLHYGN